MNSGLPTYEIRANFAIWTCGVLFAVYKFSKYCSVFENYEDLYNDFQQGWELIGRKKDVANTEWELIVPLLITLMPWMLFQIFISEVLKSVNIRILPLFQLATSAAFLLLHMNIYIVALLLLQPILFEIFAKNVFLVWICGGVSLFLISFYKEMENEYKILGINEVQYMLSITALGWINLRCLSYHLDRIKERRKRGFLDLVLYSFYLPTLFCGPFIPYEDSQNMFKIDREKFKHRIFTLAVKLLRILLWGVVLEISLHFIYVNAISFHIDYIKSFDYWALCGYAYAMGQFLHMKYVVLYGFSTAFGEFEGMIVPHTPKCLGRIHLYSDMWKYFDAGYYKFLLRYIYIPTSFTKSLYNKLLSSFLCFSFVYLWHGVYQYILLWSFLNFLGIVIENLFKYWYNKEMKTNRFLTANNKRRLGAVLTAPLLAFSAMTNIYFSGGRDVGTAFFARFFSNSVVTNFILIFFLYCCCQVSMEVKKWERNHKISHGSNKHQI